MGWHVAGGKFKDEKFDATEHILSLGGDGNVKYRLSWNADADNHWNYGYVALIFVKSSQVVARNEVLVLGTCG